MKKKLLKLISTISLVIILAFNPLITQCFCSKTTSETLHITRTIKVDDSNIDYNSFFAEFDDLQLQINENEKEVSLKAVDSLPSSLFENDDSSSLENATEEFLPIEYSFDYNALDNEFYLSVKTIKDDELLIDEWKGEAFTTEDGFTDIKFIVDGEIIYLSDLSESGMVNNCGWFSKLIKKVAKVAVAAVAVVAVVAVVAIAAPVVVSCATAVVTATSSLMVGGGVAALSGAAAASALTTVACGTAAIVGTVAVAQMAIKGIATVSQSIIDEIDKISIKEIYNIAYIQNGVLVKDSTPLSYMEALFVLGECGLINLSKTVGTTLAKLIAKLVLQGKLETVATKLNKVLNNIKNGYCGIYTPLISDAAKLAYVTGAFINNPMESENHDTTKGSGYYYHFHDITHSIHIWYGDPS